MADRIVVRLHTQHSGWVESEVRPTQHEDLAALLRRLGQAAAASSGRGGAAATVDGGAARGGGATTSTSTPAAWSLWQQQQQHQPQQWRRLTDEAKEAIQRPLVGDTHAPVRFFGFPLASSSARVGRRVLEAIQNDERYIFTHPAMRAAVQDRFARIMTGFDQADASPALQGLEEPAFPVGGMGLAEGT